MKFKIIAVGKCKDKDLLKLIADYAKRLTNKLEIIEIKPSTPFDEAAAVLQKIGNYTPILLDENGAQYNSIGFAGMLEKLSFDGNNKIAFCIGGADGHSQTLKTQVKNHISLSKMTMPHMLVRLFLTEQLYRAESIIAGHPYHRV